MPHPHGQIYAMPFIPPTVQKELASTRDYADTNGGECLFCRLGADELQAASRVVTSDEHFFAFVPYAARFPAEIAIYSRRHTRTLLDLHEEERLSLARTISIVRQKYDNLYGFKMPLMMIVKQAPLRLPDCAYHLHVQFLPLQRSATKLKYLATIETGYGTFLADTAPEQMAENLLRAGNLRSASEPRPQGSVANLHSVRLVRFIPVLTSRSRALGRSSGVT